MSFELPVLDNATWQQLAADLVRRIPQHTSQWTDFNDSDPGITLLQLLAWINESLLYQANAIPRRTYLNFMRWVLGLHASEDTTPYSEAAEKNNDFAFLRLRDLLQQVEQGAGLDAMELQAAVLAYRRAPYLALGLHDVETLAMEANLVIAREQQPPPAAQMLLALRADARVADESIVVYILGDAPWRYQAPLLQGKAVPPVPALRKVLVWQPQDTRAAAATLRATVAQYLAPRVLLGSQVLVQPVRLTDINLTIRATCAPNLRVEVLLDALLDKLVRHFLPANGWTLDVAPQAQDVRHLVLGVAGIVALERFELNFIPTPELDRMAQLGVTTLLAGLPIGAPAMLYRGLPRLRCLDVTLEPQP
jgi:hypothetical protein